MATEPSNAATVRLNDSTSALPARACRATNAGITLASVVIGPWIRNPCSTLQVGVVVDVTVERGDDVRAGVVTALPLDLLAVERMGVRLGDDSDARPPRMSEDGDVDIGRGAGRARSTASLATAARSTPVLSPSSPISAAAL